METIYGLNKNGDAIIATGVLFTVLSVVAVGLRYVSKRITNSNFRVDDWLLLAALLVYVAAEILVVRSDIIGGEAVSPEDDRYITYQQYLYIYSVFYFVIIGLVQASILLLYRQTFLPTHIRHTSIVLTVLCAIWCITALIIEIGYPGHPISFYFPGSSSATFHVTYMSFWLTMAITETVLEITILVLPIREILRLQLSPKKKSLLSLMFALGSFVVITSIIRISVLYQPSNANLDLTLGDIWLNVHLGTAIISACLPTYRPLISRKASLAQIFYPSRGSYQIEDSESLQIRKKRMRTSGSPWFTDRQYSTGQKGPQGNFVSARGSGSISMIGLEAHEDGAVESGMAIGVKQTVAVHS